MKFVLTFEANPDSPEEDAMTDEQFARSIEGEVENGIMDLGFSNVEVRVAD